MADIGGGGISYEQMQSALAAYVQTAQIPGLVAANTPTAFVNAGAYQAVADLLANYPANASRLGMYGRVNDLWGSVKTVMVCEGEGSTYYWRPQRPDYGVTSTQTNGNMTLTPLVTAPQIFMTATLTGNVSVTPSATNAWPGARFEISAPASIPALIGISLNGLIGGTLPLLAGSSRAMVYTSSGWRAE